MLENKNTTEMKNAFYGLLNRLEHSLRINELKCMSIETSKLKEEKKKENIQKLWDHFKRCNIHTMRIIEGMEEIFEEKMAENFPKFITHQIIDPGS